MPEDPHRRTTLEGVLQITHVPLRLRPHILEQIEGEGAPARHKLAKDELVVGRGTGSDIPLFGDKASRRHALIRRRNQEYSVFDLDSTHGVFLNGIRVYSAVLRDEDALQFGEAVFIYHEG
jgi:pSer/pThr/pTyr-binding forkhead associated (FHA) protein